MCIIDFSILHSYYPSYSQVCRDRFWAEYATFAIFYGGKITNFTQSL